MTPPNQNSTEPTFHDRTPAQVLAFVESTSAGLTTAQAQERLATHGPNTLPRGKTDGPLDLLWRQINSPLVWVLLASGAVAMAVDWSGDGVKNGLVILGVVVLNSIIGFVQEYKAGKAIEALSRMVPENVSVMRDGEKTSLPAAQLVPGDIVALASGDKAPADMRIIESRSLRVEEAALTGESVPAEKSVEPVPVGAPLGDRVCMVYGGTLVTYGTTTAVVVATGARTELGKISQMLRETTDLETPLTRSLKGVGLYITVGIVAISALMLAAGVWRTMNETGATLFDAARQTVIFAIALAVGAIPEGLPAIVTIALAIGVQRMASRRAVVRKLPAVETLGSTTVICSDKTGTLTRNEMTVQALWTNDDGAVEVTGVGYEPAGSLRRGGRTLAKPPASVERLLADAALCNDATLTIEPGGATITGDPTEAALVVAAEKAGFRVAALRDQRRRADAIPFESENQFMATLHDPPRGAGADEGRRIVLKGAPEVVLARCVAPDGSPLDRVPVMAQVEAMAGEGMRVLAVAGREVPRGHEKLTMSDAAGAFRLSGLVGMIDPPRQEAIDAIKACHAAGITVKMITGDHKATARAIGAKLNILADDKVFTGEQLAGMTDEQLRVAAAEANVFARVAPEHKLKLVRALQARGQIVAMTGDGVNDAPALKQANIGIAMGITGTSVSKEAAAIILTDDNFASIAAAVEEGRRVYDNLVKSLAFVLPTNLGLALILLWAVLFFPFDSQDGQLLLPMLPTQLLWINLVATVALALPLAFEAREPNVMRRPPRKPDAPVLSGFILFRTVLVAALMTAGAIGLFNYEYYSELKQGVAPSQALAEAQTMAVTTVILFQIIYMLSCRTLKASILSIGVFSNKTVFIGIGALLVLQAMFIYLPTLNAVFNSAPLDLNACMKATLAAVAVGPIIGIEKWLQRKLTRE